MTRSVRGNYARLLGGGALLLIGVGLIVYTFLFPIASTAVLCPDSMTQWELFGVSLPVVRSLSVDPMTMQLSWYDGCNTKMTSLWIPLGGSLGFLLGVTVTARELRDSQP
ncbi:hypothetical protein EIK79_05545 [Halocatena pleomorpha]|uniref:Uncharacterized protein n=2 Tax=Halocatena pleomorpha TaxID=1785090 RepID=A0A3P3RF62_9EURY|nr:hypothetical protein EIK79_05545 [Halocatena pleomorpha]